MTVACYPDYEQKSVNGFRRRTPSIEIQQETIALLQATLCARLPRSLADTDGVTLTQKNTFFHVQPNCCPHDESDNDCAFSTPDKVSREPHIPLRGRKGTEANIQYISQRKPSVINLPRCQSCPPTAPTTPCGISSADDMSTSPPIIRPSNPAPPTLYTFAPPSTSHQPITLSNTHRSSPAPPASSPDPSAKTTVMLRNIPYHEGQLGVLQLLEDRKFLGKFDFFYAPLDFNSGNNLGYAFINFKTTKDVEEFTQSVEGLRVQQEGWSAKELRVCWARVQGLNSNVEQYRNSPVNEMPPQFRPMLFSEDGGQKEFPRPDVSRPNFYGGSSVNHSTKSPTRRASSGPSRNRNGFPGRGGRAQRTSGQREI
jgi:hypothetical protein